MVCLGEQALVLMLAAQVDRRADARREFADRGHGTVNLHAAAPGHLHATTHDTPVGIAVPEVEATLHRERIGTLAHRARIRALAHQELDGREQSGLARAGLAGEHRETGGGRRDGRLADEGDILDAKLVDHRPALP